MMSQETDTPSSDGEWLKAEMRRRGLGDVDVAYRLGVSISTVQYWYRGRLPSDEHGVEIARLLDMPEIVVRARLGLHIPEELKDKERVLHAIRELHAYLWPQREAEVQRLLSEFTTEDNHK